MALLSPASLQAQEGMVREKLDSDKAPKTAKL